MSAKKEAPAEPKKSKKKALLIAAGAVVLVAASGGGVFMLMGGKNDPAKAEAVLLPAQYYALTPAFVVNLADSESSRYLQADVQLMTRDAETLAALQLHAPAIRNRLLLLFGTQSAAGLTQRPGKEKLQQQALAEVRALLKAEKGPDKVEGLYFTSLVTQ